MLSGPSEVFKSSLLFVEEEPDVKEMHVFSPESWSFVEEKLGFTGFKRQVFGLGVVYI